MVILVVVEVLIIVVFVQIVKNVIYVIIVALDVMVIVIHAMMYIVGVVVVSAELEMEYSVQIMLNYLNNIVNYKFDSQCIYYNLRKYYNLHMHNKLYNYSNYHS